MNKSELLDILAEEPVVAAVKDENGLECALKSSSSVIFLLYGDVLAIGEVCRRVSDAGKYPFVHLDLIDGLAAKEISVDFIAKNTVATGIISTKPQLIRRARTLELLAIQRFFLLDSLALKNVEKHLQEGLSDIIEVLPGLMPDIISQLSLHTETSIIAGGLIVHKQEVISALSAGAIAVSSTNPNVWSM